MGQIVDNLKLVWSKTNRWHRVLFVFLMLELKLIPAGQLGFYCNDPALSHPYTGDTVSWKWLMGVCLLLPIAVMLLTERQYHSEDKQRPKKRALRWYREYVYGFLINLTLVQVLKLVVASPRPHFFDTCRPKEASLCEGSEFVPSYTCTKAHWLNQSDRSFPSGHTSLALHAGIFIVLYLRRRAPPSKAALAAQALSAAAACACAVSRMYDHRHHWWDVLAGAAIAAAGLLYTISSLCKNFECSNSKRADEITASTNVEKASIYTET